MAEFDFGEVQPDAGEAFVVDVDGFEGPLDLLLELARRQKVDLHKISVLALAEQYLDFIAAAKRVRLELAADYLVMAAWLAYLKSRLLLPQADKKEEEPAAADLAAALANRLRHLEAIRLAAQDLANRPQLGRDIFSRGCPEDVAAPPPSGFKASLFDLLAAYAKQRQRVAHAHVTLEKRVVWSLAEARATMERLLGEVMDWAPLDDFLLDYCVDPQMARTVRASTFCASLELTREGLMSIRQDRAFGPLWVRRRDTPSEPPLLRAV